MALLLGIVQLSHAGILLPEYDLWIREIAGETSYENDALWVATASSTSDSGQRWAVAEWNLNGLPEITDARMEFAPRTQADPDAVQVAFVIDSGITGLTWESYQATKLATEVMLEGLGGITVPSGGLVFNRYAAGNNASVADLALLNSIRTSSDPKLAVAFKATNGAMEWNDGANLGGSGYAADMPIRLVVNETYPGLCIEATADTWVREISPDSSFNSDFISVWSGTSRPGQGDDGMRRYGILEFDISAAAGQLITGATLQLYMPAHGTGSGLEYPANQTAMVLDVSGTGLAVESQTWNTIQSVLPSAIPLDTLGAYNVGATSTTPEIQDAFLASAASPADLAQITAAANSSGKLTLLLVAVEDGTDYRGDWGDGEAGGLNAKLTLTIIPEPASIVLCVLGLIGVIGFLRRR